MREPPAPVDATARSSQPDRAGQIGPVRSGGLAALPFSPLFSPHRSALPFSCALPPVLRRSLPSPPPSPLRRPLVVPRPAPAAPRRETRLIQLFLQGSAPKRQSTQKLRRLANSGPIVPQKVPPQHRTGGYQPPQRRHCARLSRRPLSHRAGTARNGRHRRPVGAEKHRKPAVTESYAKARDHAELSPREEARSARGAREGAADAERITPIQGRGRGGEPLGFGPDEGRHGRVAGGRGSRAAIATGLETRASADAGGNRASRCPDGPQRTPIARTSSPRQGRLTTRRRATARAAEP